MPTSRRRMEGRSGRKASSRTGSIRCAIYTRKSSDEGLEQEFNSLDAQREACEAYIISQRHEGWAAVPDLYDDGGLSGGSMDRPALKRLLADIAASKIDIVVVYKVDRLTRSLADFAKIVDILDGNEASFVSVTQQFNTTTSMGRLTLNMLLSFAQFEREIAGERIRDKIAASKARGIWMGGNVPLGYDAIDRKLMIKAEEASTVRLIFERYAVLGSVRALREELDRRGIVSKRRISKSGVSTGGQPFSRGPLYALLQNPIYIGKITHRSQLYDGQHQAIIERDLWEQVQTQLAKNRTDRKLVANSKEPSLLAGLVHDTDGHLMTPSHANKNGRRYRYYVSTAINDPDPPKARSISMSSRASSSAPARRVPAADLERVVFDRVHRLLATPSELADAIAPLNLDATAIDRVLTRAADLSNQWSSQPSQQRRALALAIIDRIDLTDDTISLTLSVPGLVRHLGAKGAINDPSPDALTLTIPAQLRRGGKGKRLVVEGETQKADPAIIAMLQKALSVREDLLSGTFETLDSISEERSIHNGQATALLRLSWLAPSIISDITDGNYPPALTPNTLLRSSKSLPICWIKQRAHLGFGPI